VIRQRFLSGAKATGQVEAFMEHGEDFVIADDLSSLVQGMNKVTGENLIDEDHLQAQIAARDLQIDNSFSKDA
jgi:predicted oxidoreductase